MSLTRTATLGRRTLLIPLTRSTRLFTTSPYVQKSTTETAKEKVESINKSTGEAAAKGIERGQEATQSLKETVGLHAKKAEGTGSKLAGEAKGKASETAGAVKGKAQEVEGEVKGKM